MLLFLLSSLGGQQIPRFRLKEEKARDYFKKGMSFYNSQQYVSAREFYYKSLDINPSFHLARRFLGDSYYYSGEWDPALEQWEFLNSLSNGAYPLVQQRSEILRFFLNPYQKPGEFSFLDAYTPKSWRGHDFKYPVDVEFDDENNIFLLSYQSARILKIVPGGEVEREILGPLWERMKGPLSLKIYKNYIYVCDYVADKVFIFEKDGTLVQTFGKTGSGPGEFRGPSGVAVDENAIYISDSGNRRIQKFDKNGKFIIEFGKDSYGDNPEIPASIVIDSNKNLFLADNQGEKILKFDEYGNYLGDIKDPLIQNPRGLSILGDKMIIADEKKGIFFYDLQEKVISPLKNIRDSKDRLILLNRPFSAKIDRNGILYVVEYGTHRLNVFVPRGLRISNLDVKIQKIDTRSYPELAAFITVKNRIQKSLLGLSNKELRLYENDYQVRGIKTDNLKVFNNRTNIVIVKENTNKFRNEFDNYIDKTVHNLLDPIRISDKIKVVRIGSDVRMVYEGLKRKEIVYVLKSGDIVDNPNLGKGLYESITRLLPEIGPRTVVFFTSGNYYPGAFNQYTIQRIVQYAKANDVSIDVVSYEGDEDDVNREKMKYFYNKMALETGGNYYQAFNETELKNIYEDIRRKNDRRYILTWRGKSESWLSGRYVDVRVDVRYMKTFGRGDGGYFVP